MADKPTSEELEPRVGNTFICFLAFLILTICVSITFAQENKHILILHSYHKGQKWNDSITQGVESIINSNGQNIEFFFEYMDTKRFYDDRHLNNLYQLLSHKFHNHKFDAIICTDDHAYNFILERSHDLFPKTPIVFCGVNNFNEASLAGRNWITGVVESTDLAKTIEVALRLHPKIKNVFVLVDKTVSGMSHRKQLKEIVAQLNKTLTFDIPDDIELPLLKKKLQKLSKDSIVLWMNFFSDKFGNPISLKDVSELLQKNCDVPVYSLWDTRLGKGAVGGMLTSGHAQGEAAAKIALRIINGEKVENIPVIKESPNRYMFDYKQLKRFNIKSSLIPNGSIFINKPSSFYSENTGLVWLCLTIIVGLSMIVFFLVLNILKRKQAEEALREREENYRLLAENVSDIIWTMDMNMRFTYYSPAVEQLQGYTPEEAVARTIQESLTTDSFEKAIKVFSEALEEHNEGERDPSKSITLELEVTCKDGTTKMTEIQTNFTYDLSGHPIGLIGVTRDISERKRAEEALRTSHERFLTVLNSVDATIYVADLETYEILFMNKNMIENFGRDMTGEICWGVFRGESEPCPHCTNHQLIDENGKSTGLCVWQDKNPINEKWYINYDRAIEWTDGRLVKLQIATDITNLKRMEQQLQQTQKIEAIGTLAGGIAHDFNNLLMGIQGRASLMSVDFEASHSHSEHIKAIEDYIRRATDLTKQLLGFARGGKYEVKPTDINELVRNSADMFGRTKKEIRIHTKMQNPPLVVAVDRSQIEQVLLNLYVNAWQAMPDGGELYLGTKIATLDDADSKPYHAKPGRYAKVSVTDTGIGMDEAIRQRIFDPFFTTKEKGRGTGLGLASAYGIIKNHDGIITVYSEVGHGTTFNIYLPLSDQEAYREVPVEGRLIKGSETVLLVDDEEMILDVGQAMLEKLGYRVVVVEGGEQAVVAVQRKGDEIDLVILDLIMPGMDGGKVFDRIKEIRPQIPVLLSSGYAINGQATEILDRGCNGFIQKPFNITDLSQKIRGILDKI